VVPDHCTTSFSRMRCNLEPSLRPCIVQLHTSQHQTILYYPIALLTTLCLCVASLGALLPPDALPACWFYCTPIVHCACEGRWPQNQVNATMYMKLHTIKGPCLYLACHDRMHWVVQPPDSVDNQLFSIACPVHGRCMPGRPAAMHHCADFMGAYASSSITLPSYQAPLARLCAVHARLARP
jgi:hypothetical protein